MIVQSPTLAQIDAYLARLGEPLDGVRSLLHRDPVLQEVINTPLMVNIITLAYQGQPLDTLPPAASPEHWRQHLFTTYIQHMLTRRHPDSSYLPHQIMIWLSWLAKTLTHKSQTTFLIEHLQPDRLLSKAQQRWLAVAETVVVAVLMGLVGGVGVGLHAGFETGWTDGLTV